MKYLDREAAARNDRYKGVVAIDTPVGEFRYEYGSEMPQGAVSNPRDLLANLVRVHLPTGYDHDKKRHAWTDRGSTVSTITRHYHFEDPRHPTLITGISINGTGSDGKHMHERISTYAYDSAGKAIMSVKGEPLRRDGQGKPVPGTGIEQVTLDRSEPGKTSVTNSLGQVTVYRYGIYGGEYRITEVRGPGCAGCGESNVRYGYDKLGRLSETTRLGESGEPTASIRHELDKFGRIANSSRIQYASGKPGKPSPLIRNEYPHATEAEDRAAQPTVITRPSVVSGRQRRTVIEYNAFRQPLLIKDTGWSPGIGDAEPTRIERITKLHYANVNGRSLLAAVRHGDGVRTEQTRIEYDEHGNFPVKVTTASGLTIDIVARHRDGRPQEVRLSDGVRTTVTNTDYLPDGQLRAMTRTARVPMAGGPGEQRQIELRHDALARPAELRMPTHVRAILRDAMGDTSDRADAAALHRGSREDEHGLYYLTGEAGSTAEHEITEILAAASPSERTSVARRWLDDFGRLVAVQYRGQGIARASYLGASNRISSLIDAAGAQTRLTYDDTGKLSKRERYDTSGKQRERIEYKYSGQLLVEQAKYAGIQSSEADSVIRMAYNASGQILTEHQQSGTRSYAVNHAYDNAGRRIRTWMTEYESDGTASDLPAVRYRYPTEANGGDRIAAIEIEGAWFRSKRIAGALEWLGGKQIKLPVGEQDGSVLAGWVFGNGLKAKSGYQPNSHAGLPWKLLDHHDGVHRHVISSRSDGRILDTLQADDIKQSGPPTPHAPVPTPPAPSAARRQAAQIPGHTAQAVALPLAPADTDSAGRVLTHRSGESHYKLDWNAAGELEQVRQEKALVAQYRYDAEGRRIEKSVQGQPDAARHFIYDGKQLVAESDAAGQILRQYLYIGWRPVAWIEPARTIKDRVRQIVYGPKIVYLHTDHRGAVTAATDDDKTILWQARVDERGNIEPRDEQSRRFEQPLRLVNQYADDETGLHYNLARYYDPATGNFLSPDPAGFDAGFLDLYAYANGDMYNLVDPDGWATITYYLIDTARNAHGARRDEYRWAFWIRGIAAKPALNILYDKDGNFIANANPNDMPAPQNRRYISWEKRKGADTENLTQEFVDHYVNDLISPNSFTTSLDDQAALQILADLTSQGDVIRKYYACETSGTAGNPERAPKLVLPPVKLRAVTLNPGGVPGENDAPEDRRVDQGVDQLTCKQAMTPEQAFQRLKRAIVLKESRNADCTSTGCPARTWNPSGTPASYGSTQFVVATFIERMLSFSKTKAPLKHENLAYTALYNRQANMTDEESRLLGFTDGRGKDSGLRARLEGALLRSVHVLGGTFKGKKVIGWRNKLNDRTVISPANASDVTQFAKDTGFSHLDGSTSSEAYRMYVKMVKWHQLIVKLTGIRVDSNGKADKALEIIEEKLRSDGNELQPLLSDFGVKPKDLKPYLGDRIWNEGWQGFAAAAAFIDPAIRKLLLDDQKSLFKDKERFDLISDREIRWKYAQYRAKFETDEEADIVSRIGYFHNSGSDASNLNTAHTFAYAKGLKAIWNRESKDMPCEVRPIKRFSLNPSR